MTAAPQQLVLEISTEATGDGVVAAKVCTRCKEAKPLSEFSRKGAGHQSMDRECNKAYQREHYQANRRMYLDKAAAQQRRIVEWIRAYKEARGCMDCGQRYPHFVLDFDHVGGKNFTIGEAGRNGSLRRVQAEVALCDVVCANCHRVRTWAQGCFGHSPHGCSGHAMRDAA